jgi:hypothetical protein
LFTTGDLLGDGETALRAAAAEIGASIENVRTAPDFLRRLVRRGADGVVVDLVHERAPQGGEAKRQFGFVWVDPPGEILANKLCTLLSRAELRDLVDVLALERAGFHVEEAVPLAVRKDAGMTPGQLGWVLSQISIGDDAVIPGGESPADLRSYLSHLIHRLARLAFPRPAP